MYNSFVLLLVNIFFTIKVREEAMKIRNWIIKATGLEKNGTRGKSNNNLIYAKGKTRSSRLGKSENNFKIKSKHPKLKTNIME